jgi:hypothetical protein
MMLHQLVLHVDSHNQSEVHGSCAGLGAIAHRYATAASLPV